MLTQLDQYRISFSADPVELIFLRAGLNRWLAGLQWPEPDRIDAVLAVSEACDNCVRHAYDAGDYHAGDNDAVELVARVQRDAAGRRIVIVVRDHGRRRPAWRDRGYGLTTVRACMDQVRIRRSGAGTVVTMTSRPVPLLD